MSGHQLAQGVASLGRNGESMLVHMQPREVAGLQAIAMQHGGSLTINPETGLPEAGWFGDILGAVAPIALGTLLGPAGLGMSALGAGMSTGLAGFALSGGNLSKGLMAGLGGYGGANLGSNLSAFGAETTPIAEIETLTNTPTLGAETGQFMKPYAAETMGGMQSGIQNAVNTVGQNAMTGANTAAGNLVGGAGSNIFPGVETVAEASKPGLMGNIGSGVSKIMQPGGLGNYSDFLKAGYTDAAGNLVQNSPWMDAMTIASVPMAIQPPEYKAPEDTSYQMKYEGPYTAQDRSPRTPTAEELQQLNAAGSPEYSYFGATNPYPGFNKAPGYAEGGMTSGGMTSGGVADLYDGPDGTAAQNTLAEPYGLGRLNNLASAAATENAKVVGFDAGGYIPSVGSPSYGIAPTDLSQVAAISNTGAVASTPSGLSNLLGNAITDPMGRTTGNQAEPNGMSGKGGSGNIGMGGLLGKLLQQSGSPTMQDYIASAQRTYDPAASIRTGTMPGTIEEAQFTNINPQQPGHAAGGGLADGGFVVPADVVSHLGNGSTDAGLAALQKRHKAQPIRGAGDGMSDSIPTTINGKQPARVADGEAYIPPEQVKRSGGAKKFYAMMDKVRKERTGTKKQGKQINPSRLMAA